MLCGPADKMGKALEAVPALRANVKQLPAFSLVNKPTRIRTGVRMGIGTLRRYYKEWGYGSPVTVPESVAAPEPVTTLEPTPEEVAAAELHKRAVELVVAAGHSVEAAEKLISEIGAAKVLEVTKPEEPAREKQEIKPSDVGNLTEILPELAKE